MKVIQQKVRINEKNQMDITELKTISHVILQTRHGRAELVNLVISINV